MMDGSRSRDDPIDAGWCQPPPKLSTYFGIIRRQAGLLIAFLLASAVAGLAVIVLADPVYTARVLLYIDPEPGVDLGSEQAIAMELATQVELIRSDETVDTVIRILGLERQPEFIPSANAMHQFVSDLRAQLRGVPEEAALFSSDRQLEMVKQMRANLRVSRVGNTRMIEVRYFSGSPAFAVTVVDTFARAHLDRVSTRDERSAGRRIERLELRAAEMRNMAAAASAQIHAALLESGDYAANPLELEEHTATLRTRLSELDSEIGLLSMKRAWIDPEAETEKRAAIAANTDESRRLLNDLAIAEARLENVRSRPGVSPELVHAVERAVDAVLHNLRHELGLAITSIDLQLDAANVERSNIRRQISGLRDYIGGDLQAQLETARRDKLFYEQMHHDYLNRLEELHRQPQARRNIRLVSNAMMPSAPSAPNQKAILAVSLTLGLFMAIGVALLREWRREDRSGRTLA